MDGYGPSFPLAHPWFTLKHWVHRNSQSKIHGAKLGIGQIETLPLDRPTLATTIHDIIPGCSIPRVITRKTLWQTPEANRLACALNPTAWDRSKSRRTSIGARRRNAHCFTSILDATPCRRN